MPELPKRHGYADKLFKEENNRNYLIVKGNRIVQDVHFTMPLVDQKILGSLIRSIKPNQESLTVEFSTKQYMRMLGLRKSGTMFQKIIGALQNISNDNFFIKMPDGKYHLWRWIDDAVADPNGDGIGAFKVTFNPKLKQYLFNKSLRYRTIYKFSDIMLMQSRYSPRLFEIFRSNQSRQKEQKRGLNYTLNEIRYDLDLIHRNGKTGPIKKDRHGNIKFKYPRYYNLRKRVLDPAQREINELTEYDVHFTPIKQGRSVTKINVRMKHKNKRELRRRNNIIYYKVNHIPRSQWKTWRTNIINGKGHFHTLHKNTKDPHPTDQLRVNHESKNFSKKQQILHTKMKLLKQIKDQTKH